MRKTLRIFAFLLALLLMPASDALAEFAARVQVNRMPVYADEAMTQKLGNLRKGEIVIVDSYEDGVAHIAYQGRSGFAAVSGMRAVSGEAQDATIAAAVRVYQGVSANSRSAVLKKGTAVKLLMTAGNWAMIEKNGYIGYTARQYVLVSAPEEETSEVVYETFTAEVTADSLTVYAGANAVARQLTTLARGTQVTVVAYNKTWACLKRGKTYGFALTSGLKRAESVEPTPPPTQPEETVVPTPTPTPTPAPTPTPTPTPASTSFEDAVKSGRYSNEQLIFLFLTREMGLNTAAACGILSNVYSECNFDPTVYYQGSYGICQWLGVRRTKLENYCAAHGYDYRTLVGQLYFLKDDLKDFPKIDTYMRNVANTADGAYDAGHYWCYYYEVPANRSSNSVKRGNRARDVYWPKYK